MQFIKSICIVILSLLSLSLYSHAGDIVNEGNVSVYQNYTLGGADTQYVTKNNTYDYYKITVEQDGEVQIDLLNVTNQTLAFTFNYNSGYDEPNPVSLTDGKSLTYPNAAAGSILYIVVYANTGTADSGTYTINISLTATSNIAPVAEDDYFVIAANSATGNVLSNDIDINNDPITVTATTPSPLPVTLGNGTLQSMTSSGTFTYSTSGFFSGYDTFTYTVEDNGSASDTGTVYISWPFPVANDKVLITGIDEILTGNIISSLPADSDINDSLTVISVDGGSVGTNITTAGGGTINIASDGSFSYTPVMDGANHIDSFTYTITNIYGNTDQATVTVYVNDYCAHTDQFLNTYTGVDFNETDYDTPPGVTSGDIQYYKITLDEAGYLDVNLSNIDPANERLYYDFGGGSIQLPDGTGSQCIDLFAKGTTSELSADTRTIRAVLELEAGDYYFALYGSSKDNPVDYYLSTHFYPYDGGTTPDIPTLSHATIGFSEYTVDYTTDDKLHTKIVNDPFGLRATNIDSDGNPETYTGSIDMAILIELVDNCGDTTNEVFGELRIHNGDAYIDTVDDSIFNIDFASKKKILQTKAIDWGEQLDGADNINCGGSSITSGLCLLPACMNSTDNIRSVFPPALYPHVSSCLYGDGTGTHAPCDTEAYNGSCQGKKPAVTIGPIDYNNDYGCAMCLANAVATLSCSDPFAIRPDAFDANIVNNTTYQAGVNNAFTFDANDIAGAPSAEYNELEDSSFVVDINISDASKVCAEQNIKIDPSVAFVDGTHSGSFSFDNVGAFELTIREKSGSEFAHIDVNDTGDSDRYIQEFQRNITVIPSGFYVDANLSDSGNLFTYLSNFENFPNNEDRNMSAALHADIEARAQGGAITTNYTETCYAKDGNLSLVIADGIFPLTPDPTALTKLLYYDVTEAALGSVDFADFTYSNVIPIPIASEDYNVGDDNGTTSIDYLINFDRDRNKPVNPIRLEVSSATMLDEDGVNGTDTLLDQNQSTFYYGRLHAPRTRIVGPTGTARFYYEVYCNTANGCTTGWLSDVSNRLSVDDIYWHQNHNHTVLDGNISTAANAIVPRNASLISDFDELGDVWRLNSDVTDARFVYDEGKAYPYKATIEVDPSNWLIYHRYNAAAVTNSFELEFNNVGGKAGLDAGAASVDINASTNTNRRISW